VPRLTDPAFKPVEFDGFRKQAGLSSFTLTPKQWIKATNAIGDVSKAGRYGGTFAHAGVTPQRTDDRDTRCARRNKARPLSPARISQ
jgi:hypothetical protein